MKILVCAFPAYADHGSNPAEQILQRLSRNDIEKVLLPFSWRRSKETLEAKIDETKADMVLVLNLCPYRHSPTLEQYAYNQMNETSLPDDDGEVRRGEKVCEDGPASLRFANDVSALADTLRMEGSYCSNSIDPGRFLDNEVYYAALAKGKNALLVHIPLQSDFPLEESYEMVDRLIDLLPNFAQA